jgi:CRP-like cAMP-binding protein
MAPNRIELLQNMPVFGGAREDTLQFLLAQARTTAVPAGGYFFRENDAASSMFVLDTGRATVVKTWRERELVLHSLGPGDCFGEMSLMDLGPRSAAVCAEEDCVAIELTAADLLCLFEHDVEQFALIQMNIGREVCRRLRATDELLFRATMGEAPAGLDSVFLTG